MADNSYSEVYTLIPVYDETEPKQIYGYIAFPAYLINENTIINNDGTSYKQYEIVYAKNVENLNINTYDRLKNQEPIFNGEKCMNSIITNEVYTMFDIAKEEAVDKSKKLFEELAKDKLIHPSNYGRIRDLHSLKRAIDEEKANLESRFIELNIIEKYLNGQSKRR